MQKTSHKKTNSLYIVKKNIQNQQQNAGRRMEWAHINSQIMRRSGCPSDHKNPFTTTLALILMHTFNLSWTCTLKYPTSNAHDKPYIAYVHFQPNTGSAHMEAAAQ